MKCPYCNTEMTLGYIQCIDGVYWSEKKRTVSRLPPLNNCSLELATGGGPLSGSAVEAYRCAECKKIVIDYSEIDT